MLAACLTTQSKAAPLFSPGSSNDISRDFGTLTFPWGKGVTSREGVGVALFFCCTANTCAQQLLPVILSIGKEDPQERLSLPGVRRELCKLTIIVTS